MPNISTLENLSFKVLIENFSRYISGFEATEDDRFRNNMFFLQLTYSKILLCELDKKNLLKEIHLDFLLNEHLQDLDIALVIFHSNIDNIKEKLIPIAHTFVKLSYSKYYCYGKEYLDILTAVIPHAVNVNKIYIPHICNDNLLNIIASSCPHLTKLDINESSVSDLGLSALCGRSENQAQSQCKLTNLNLTSTQATCDGVVNILREIPSLQELIFNQVPSALYYIHKADIDDNSVSSAQKYNLTSLDFTKYYDDSSLLLKLLTVCAELCPFVKKLAVPISGQESLDVCLLYPQLENFTLERYEYTFFPKIDLNNFLALKGQNLKALNIEHCSVSMSNLVENCPNLESLELGGVDDEHLDIKSTKSLRNLKEMKLDTPITDSIIALLNTSPNVKTLRLYNSGFALLGDLSSFAFSTNLRHLYIYFSDLKVNLVQQIILNCPFLETLSLNDCDNISYDDVNVLRKFIKTFNRNIDLNIKLNYFNDYLSDSSFSGFEVDSDDSYNRFSNSYSNDSDDYDSDDYYSKYY